MCCINETFSFLQLDGKKTGLGLTNFHPFGTVWLFNSFPNGIRIHSPLVTEAGDKRHGTKQDGHIHFEPKNTYEYPIDVIFLKLELIKVSGNNKQNIWPRECQVLL